MRSGDKVFLLRHAVRFRALHSDGYITLREAAEKEQFLSAEHSRIKVVTDGLSLIRGLSDHA